MQRRLVIAAFAIGAVLLVLAALYIAIPADHLPSFIPGYDADLARRHLKRAAEVGLIGAALVLYAWVQVEPPARRQRRD